MAQVLGPAEPQLSEEQLLKTLNPAVDTLTNTYVQSDVDREKVIQYANVRRNHLYWEGKQFLYPVVANGQVVDFSSVSGSILSSQPNADNSRPYDYVINHLRGDGRKFVAVLGQRAPNIKARPDRPSDEKATRLARRADDLASLLRSHWRVEYVQRHLALSLWKNGTTFLYTPYIANGDLYGYTEEPQLGLADQALGEPAQKCLGCGASIPVDENSGESPTTSCPDCGGELVREEPPTASVPQQLSTQKLPNGSVELHIASVMEVTTPFYVRDLQQTPWLWYEYEEHKASLLRAFPKLKDLVKDDTADRQLTATTAGKTTRDIASGPNAQLFARGNRWLFQRFWLRPSMFSLLGSGKDSDTKAKKLLEENFPDGLKATYVNGKLVQLENERLDDVWTMVKPETSEYIYATPLCEDYLGPQDVINDTANIMIEWLERAIPLTVVDPQVFDIEALRKFPATPMEFLPARAGAGGSIKDAMSVMPVAKPEPQMMAYSERIREEARQIVGILPPIFGGDTGTQTAREAELKRNQAMMQLGTTWNEMRGGWTQAFENGVKQLAKHSGDRVYILMGSGKKPSMVEMADLAEMAEGGWHYEAEESMPMTWGQRRDVIWDIIGKGPQVWELVGLQHPANLPMVQETLGLPDYHVPGLKMRDKIMDTIQKLLAEKPQLGTDPMTGTMTASPSIPIDPSGIEEDHRMAVSCVSEWAASEEGRRAKEDPATHEGYANVLAWAREHLKAMTPPPMAEPAPGPKGPSPEPKPAEGGPRPGPGGPPPKTGAESGPQPPILQKGVQEQQVPSPPLSARIQ